jgi:hypothetical protein
MWRRYHDGNRCVESFNTQTTPRIGFRHGSVATARTYKRPESALSKITFRAGRSRASQTPRAPDAAGSHRRTHRGAAGRASPASRGRRSVRTAAAKGQKPTICGLEAPGALRRTPHEAHADETWYIVLCWTVARVPAESSCAICVHALLAAGALVESGAENSRTSEYGGAVN